MHIIIHRLRALALALACALVVGVPAIGHAADSPPQVLIMLPTADASSPALAAGIARWRKAGLVRNATQLDATEQKEPGFSSLTLLEMTDEAAWKRWEKSEAPGFPKARVRRADVCVHGERPDKNFAKALFEVNVYRIKTTSERYADYCNGYISPLMQGQADAGLMNWYTMYVERGPAGETDAVLVKAYRDAATYEGKVTDFKLELRKRLTAQHPSYPKWHAIKETLRDDVSETLAVVRESAP